jgi:hypothetical protein
MTAYELYVAIANWIGWPAVAGLLILVISILVYIHSEQKHTFQAKIDVLQMELENLKATSTDILIQRVLTRHKIAMEEIASLSEERQSMQKEKEKYVQEIEQREEEIIELRQHASDLVNRLIEYKEELKEAFNLDDYCDVCDPDEDHMEKNYIEWLGHPYVELEGDTELVKKFGSCNYCFSPSIQCAICGTITSINMDGPELIECEGGCGLSYLISDNRRDKDDLVSIIVRSPEAENE